MQHKRLVIDANILIRAVLGSRVRHLIEYYCESVAFYMAEANANEAEFYLSTELAANVTNGINIPSGERTRTFYIGERIIFTRIGKLKAAQI
jgi:hypothetical protein